MTSKCPKSFQNKKLFGVPRGSPKTTSETSSVMLGGVWNKLGARVVPKPSIPVPRCFYKSGKVVLESVPEDGFILNVMLQEKCKANPYKVFVSIFL